MPKHLEAESWAASMAWVVAAVEEEKADTEADMDAMDVVEAAPEVEAEQELEAMEVEGGGVDACYDDLLAEAKPCMAALLLGLMAASVTAASEPEAVAEPAGISMAAAVDGDDDGGDDPGLAEAIQRSMMQPLHGHASSSTASHQSDASLRLKRHHRDRQSPPAVAAAVALEVAAMVAAAAVAAEAAATRHRDVMAFRFALCGRLKCSRCQRLHLRAHSVKKQIRRIRTATAVF
ncbi:hypothetical protein Vretimale_19176 [Volvox reticuliferus]|uniref:Uncharacterized protein n=1 Tax=Volvox reticuliferus TaxID=1737510 RepID=A0A8J4M095_9CHLO|nr:hypothetical protein Vretimale_19176 [Volvox reticuliferus]